MPDLTFVYRTEEDPTRRRPFQEGRPRFLQDGSIVIDDGNNWARDESGAWVVTSTDALLRPVQLVDPSVTAGATVEPGDIVRLQVRFRLGRIKFYDTTTTHLPLTSSKTMQFLDGRVSLLETPALAALTNFAFWPTGQSDLADQYVETATDVDSGGVSQAPVRMSAVFVPHKDARYLAVGAKVYSLSNSITHRRHHFKKWMLEKMEGTRTTPTSPYGAARQVLAKIRPDRLNYWTNNFTVDNTWLSGLAGTTLNAPVAGVLTLVNSVSQVGLGLNWISEVELPQDTWTLTWEFKSPVLRHMYVVNVSQGVTSPTKDALPNQWTKMTWTFTTDARYFLSVNLRADADTTQGIGATGDVRNVLLERGEEAKPYFHGSSSVDTLWETGKTAGKTRSYLYINRAERYDAIKRVLQENVPLGIGVAEPQFATLPPD